MSKNNINCIGVMTSGGDAPGMNAAVRAVVKTACKSGIDVFAIYQGYKGMVEGGDMIKKMTSDDVGGILHKGGTAIGTARCHRFRERAGRLVAAKNLIERKIDNLVIIGGDGSLTGANLFRDEWPGLVQELLENKEITKEQAQRHPLLKIVGLVGSIDNDLSGTDMTIGADTALRRIIDAIDAISSTAASHERTFVVEVMGRNCGYLALFSAIATGADYVLIPERPPVDDDWGKSMCDYLSEGRKAGKKKSLVIVAEGAIDKYGNQIRSTDVVSKLKEHLKVDVRLTILGHVQRGGSPTAFDRYMSIVLGHAAVKHLIESTGDNESKIIGLQKNHVTELSLTESIDRTRSIAKYIKEGNFDKAIELRGGSFNDELKTFKTLAQAFPSTETKSGRKLNILVLNAGSLAPGMNAAVRTAVRIALEGGHNIYGVKNGFKGLAEGDIVPVSWMEVEDWASEGGSFLGTNRMLIEGKDFYEIAKTLEKWKVDGIIMIGGSTAYVNAYRMLQKKNDFPAFDISTVCIPATINNNLPGTDFCIGSDTALNNIVDAIDKIKESAVATTRTFVVEVFGRYCGFLAQMGGLATGAERVYIHEKGIHLDDLKDDVKMLVKRFKEGKRLGLVIRNEFANKIYTTAFVSALYEEEGGDVFDVRQAILGHLQQGGKPSSFDRVLATRLAAKAVDLLEKQRDDEERQYYSLGLKEGQLVVEELDRLPSQVNMEYFRPKKQWWINLGEINDTFK
ncbi:MAG: 6-phosphofructokinase [Chlorobi bacterium]|nr:6-phosphofructokinase [Chlorobiota bacterium]